MSESAREDDDFFDPSPIDERYAPLEPGDGELVIYDRENHQAWIQSSHGYDVHKVR